MRRLSIHKNKHGTKSGNNFPKSLLRQSMQFFEIPNHPSQLNIGDKSWFKIYSSNFILLNRKDFTKEKWPNWIVCQQQQVVSKEMKKRKEDEEEGEGLFFVQLESHGTFFWFCAPLHKLHFSLWAAKKVGHDEPWK